MSLATLEREIVSETREVAKRPKLRKKDLIAWSTSPDGAKVDDEAKEMQVHLPRLGVYVVIPK